MIGYRARLGETGHSSVPTVLAPQRRMEDNAQGRDCVSSAIGEAIPRRLGVSLNASASFRGFRRLRARQADRTTCRRPSEQGRCLASPLRGNGMARGVRAIFDITNSGVGLAVQDLTKARDRIVIFDSASSSDLTSKACSSNRVPWNADNWSSGVADASSDQAEARQLLLHHRRLRLRRFPRGLRRPRFASAPRRLRPVR
jgi:hypothetical protein